MNGPVFHLGGGVFVTVKVEAADIEELDRERRLTRRLAICFCGKNRMGYCPDCGYFPPADRARREAVLQHRERQLEPHTIKRPPRRSRRAKALSAARCHDCGKKIGGGRAMLSGKHVVCEGCFGG